MQPLWACAASAAQLSQMCQAVLAKDPEQAEQAGALYAWTIVIAWLAAPKQPCTPSLSLRTFLYIPAETESSAFHDLHSLLNLYPEDYPGNHTMSEYDSDDYAQEYESGREDEFETETGDEYESGSDAEESFADEVQDEAREAESDPEEAEETSRVEEQEHEQDDDEAHYAHRDRYTAQYEDDESDDEKTANSTATPVATAGTALGGALGSLFGSSNATTTASGGSWLDGLKSGLGALNIGGGGQAAESGVTRQQGYGQQDQYAQYQYQQKQYDQQGQYGAPQPGDTSARSGLHEGRDFEYSRCTGRHRAVLVGINYFNQKGQLNGCINDVHNVTRFLQGKGYQDITILTDDTNNPNLMPTKQNIVRAMQHLVDGAQRDDSLFFHYSGHGTQAQGGDHTEADGLMEAICPVDYESAGLIHDRDSLPHSDPSYQLLVKPLPAGCRLTAVFDSCHSGTVMNLPFAYSTRGIVKEPNFMADTGRGLLRAAPQYIAGDAMGAAKSLFGAAMSSFKESQAGDALRAQNTSSADVISFSGCKDEQTSADTTEEGQATGAMSYALIKALSSDPNISYKQLLNNVRREMINGGYSQKPQLSACHPIDTDLQFVV